MKSVLVVGGAGYIGSHMVKTLSRAGYDVVVLDNLINGNRALIKYGKFVEGDLSNRRLLKQLFVKYEFSSVIHFAGFSLVGESMHEPEKYYHNNVVNTLNLLDVMIKNKVLSLVFSSTAAIFGNPVYTPIDEQHPKDPINPYGKSKLMIEHILQDYAYAYGLNSTSLRYFNACGADPEFELGEMHNPETHLIPLVLQAASGRKDSICIFGEDYPTDDGTCIRDYIHVQDLCQAHHLAMLAMFNGILVGANQFNLGSSEGFSVKQVIDTAKSIVEAEGFSILTKVAERRPGDPAVLIADSTLAKKTLKWKPQYQNLETIIQHAWAWEKNLIS